MPDIFADTAGWGHLVDSSQAYHAQAAAIYRHARQQGRRLITTNYILTELVALLISPLRIPHPHIFIVRDKDQVILQGLSGHPEVILLYAQLS